MASWSTVASRGIAPRAPSGAGSAPPPKLSVGASEVVAPRAPCVPSSVVPRRSVEEEIEQHKGYIRWLEFDNKRLKEALDAEKSEHVQTEADYYNAYRRFRDNIAEERKKLAEVKADLAQRERDLSLAEAGFYRVMDALLKEREKVAELKALLSGVNGPK